MQSVIDVAFVIVGIVDCSGYVEAGLSLSFILGFNVE